MATAEHIDQPVWGGIRWISPSARYISMISRTLAYEAILHRLGTKMLDHKHLIINAVCANPLVNPDATVDWLNKLVEAVDMKIKIGPFADYCTSDQNNGITAAVCIETSHASIHFWDKVDPPYFRFDLYSCATFDKEIVFGLLHDFDVYYMDYMMLDRNDGIEVMEKDWRQIKPVINLLLPDEKEIYLKLHREKNRPQSDEEKAIQAKYARLSNKFGRGIIELNI
jgi:S-adenosylmethionine/arginine decarboxylase-like enzyme